MIYLILRPILSNCSLLAESDIQVEGLFLNADAGFDGQDFRELCTRHHVEVYIAFNERNGSILDREAYFDEALYHYRNRIEHAFAWVDTFKATLFRYETKLANWFAVNLIVMAILFARKFNHILKP